MQRTRASVVLIEVLLAAILLAVVAPQIPNWMWRLGNGPRSAAVLRQQHIINAQIIAINAQTEQLKRRAAELKKQIAAQEAANASTRRLLQRCEHAADPGSCYRDPKGYFRAAAQ